MYIFPPPEFANKLALFGLNTKILWPYKIPATDCRQVWGRTLASPLGIAGGFDKSARALNGFWGQQSPYEKLGVGWVEIGTITRHPQAGNSGTRVWRVGLPKRGSLKKKFVVVNRMGLPNLGAEAVAARFQRFAKQYAGHQHPFMLTANITMGHEVPLNDPAAIAAELAAIRQDPHIQAIAAIADAVVWNISCPNRETKHGDNVLDIEGHLRAAADALREAGFKRVLAKLAPDLADGDLARVAGLAVNGVLDGVSVTNTLPSARAAEMLSSDDAQRFAAAAGAAYGGISGDLLTPLADNALQQLAHAIDSQLGHRERPVIISSGGVMTPEVVARRMKLGATIVQAYTGLIANPRLLRAAAHELRSGVVAPDAAPTHASAIASAM